MFTRPGNRENPDDSNMDWEGVPILRQPHESSPGDNLELLYNNPLTNPKLAAASTTKKLDKYG
jgi:hypothetical protein